MYIAYLQLFLYQIKCVEKFSTCIESYVENFMKVHKNNKIFEIQNEVFNGNKWKCWKLRLFF